MENKREQRQKQARFFMRVMLAKMSGLPKRFFSQKMRNIMEHWSIPMLWMFVKSRGDEVYIDQPCFYTRITDRPKARVDEPYRFTPEQLLQFHKNGFIGPLRAMSEEEMGVFRKRIEPILNQRSDAFGKKTVRDRHLDEPFIRDLFRRPEITERVAQLLGPDLMVWRSQVFNQKPGASSIEWHQASTYMAENFRVPILIPRDKNDLFQLTIWIAIDEATVENGCMYFLPGTHDKIRTIIRGGDSQFYQSKFTLNYDINPKAIVHMPLKPGEFVIFSERVIHGSPGNNSDKRRMGINFRVVSPETTVYQNQKKHYALHLNTSWDLSNWGCMMIRGNDNYHRNKMLKEQVQETAAVNGSVG